MLNMDVKVAQQSTFLTGSTCSAFVRNTYVCCMCFVCVHMLNMDVKTAQQSTFFLFFFVQHTCNPETASFCCAHLHTYTNSHIDITHNTHNTHTRTSTHTQTHTQRAETLR